MRSSMRLLSALGAAGLLLMAGGAAARELKISHQFPAEGDNRDRAARLFVAEVVARVPSFKFTIHPNLSLKLKAEEQFDALKDGRIEMAVVPLPYVTYHPGPTVDILAEQAGEATVRITGHRAFHDEGELRMTTVYVSQPEDHVTLPELVRAYFDPDAAVWPRSAVYGPEETNETSDQESAVAMASSQDTAAFAAFFHAMLDAGVYLPPSAYEGWFLSSAHDERAVQTVLDALPGAARSAAEAAS